MIFVYFLFFNWMTLEKSPIFLNGYDNRENSVSNNGSIQMEEAGSRRRKGKPKKCVDSVSESLFMK